MSDIPASSSHATKAMEAAEEVCSLMFAAKGNVTSREMIAMVADNLRKHMPPSVPVSELRKWQDDLKIAVGETTEYSTRIMLEIIIDDIDELIEANTQEVF